MIISILLYDIFATLFFFQIVLNILLCLGLKTSPFGTGVPRTSFPSSLSLFMVEFLDDWTWNALPLSLTLIQAFSPSLIHET